MPVSPQDYALWAAATGNPYPTTAQEKARLAPEVYDFNRGFGKFRGFDQVESFQGDVVYDQPLAVRHYGDNSLLQSPITPDNNVPKVAGQLNNTLTGQHYTQHYADNAVDTGLGGTEQPKSLLEKAALGALGVGAVAAGVYGAQKLTGRDLGVGRIGGMVRNLGEKAKSSLKSALGLADEATNPSFVTRTPTENVLAVAQHGTAAIDDVAPGIVREQNVMPRDVRVNQALKTRVPDPWSESALGQAGEMLTAPAAQSVIPSQTSAAGVDPDITERVSQFSRKIGYGPITTAPSLAGIAESAEMPTAGMFGGKSQQMVTLPRGGLKEGVQEEQLLTGLLSPQRSMPEGALSGVQRSFSADPRVATVQKQAENIFQATGDPSVIRSAYGEAPGLPIRVTLPSGESVPTSSLYSAFGPVVNPQTGIPVAQSRAESLQAALNMQGAMKARALEQLGVPSTYQPSQEQLQMLDPRTKRLLIQTGQSAETARNRLAQAQASGMLYKLRPEVTEGIRQVPIISETTGEIAGSRIVPEVEGMPTSEFYQMRAAGGAGRQEVGGVGRRREALATEGFAVPQGSTLEATPYLYRNVDTGEILTEGQLKREDVLGGAVRPIRGTAVEPQRIMGSEGRTFKGVSQDVIDPRSFDPAALAEIAEATPERIDPSTGLAYSTQAMGGEKIAQERRQIEAMRQSGARIRGRMGTELPASIVRGRGVSASGVDPALGTRFARQGSAAEGSARAQAGELVRQRMELVRKALRGEL